MACLNITERFKYFNNINNTMIKQTGSTQFECINCNLLKEIDQGVWVDIKYIVGNVMKLVCKDCYNKVINKKVKKVDDKKRN